jgi:hypothetical protein
VPGTEGQMMKKLSSTLRLDICSIADVKIPGKKS